MQLLGIINLTPDSFSDGGKNFSVATALANARKLINEGAAFIDIGAESTRPGAVVISPEEEWQRLKPFIELATDIPLSIDTRNYETAALALEYKQVKILNDVSGLTDERTLKLAAQKNIPVIVMHSLTVPADKNVILQEPPVPAIESWIKETHTRLTQAGIKPQNIIFDVGLGFGKNAQQSLELIEAAAKLAEISHLLGCRILYGHSRKSFMNVPPEQKDAETARISALLAAANVDFARVHDIKSNHDALRI